MTGHARDENGNGEERAHVDVPDRLDVEAFDEGGLAGRLEARRGERDVGASLANGLHQVGL